MRAKAALKKPRASFKRCCGKNPTGVRPTSVWEKPLRQWARSEEATKQFKEALKNRIRTPESFNTLAKFSFSRGWYDAAVTNFTDSLRLNPSDPETQVNLGLALVKLGQAR